MHPRLEQEQQRIQRWIELGPQRPGGIPPDARLKHSSVAVWALIGQLQLDGWDIAAVADWYEVPCEAIQAAIGYYRQNQAAIDARLAANRALFTA